VDSPSRRLQVILAMLVASVVMQIGFQLFKPDPEGAGFDVEGGFAYVAEPRVEVMYGGLEPRKEVRLRPTAGKREFRLVLWTQTDGGDGATGVQAETQVELRIRGQIRSVADDGSFEWHWKVLDATVVTADGTGSLIEAEQSVLLAGLEGMKGFSVVDGRGFVLRSVLRDSGGVSTAELRQGLAQTLQEPSVHLPAEPIGDRAVWTVHRRDRRDGAEVSSVDRVEIEHLTVHAAEVTIRTTETASRQTLAEGRFMNLASMKTDLVRLDGKGRGEWSFGLDGQLAVEGEGWLDRQSDLRIGLTGLERELRLNVRSETAIDSP